LALALCAALCVTTAPRTAPAESGDAVPLSLDECLTTALANNLDLVAAKKDPAIAEQEILRSRAPFDGVIDASASYNDSSSDRRIIDNTTATEGQGDASSNVWNGDVSFSNLLQYGGNYSLAYHLTDVDADSTQVQAVTGFLTASTFTQQTDGFTLRYDMPLLKGFGKEVNTVNVLLARGGLAISEEDLRLQAMQTIRDVEDAYWNALAAREAVRISKLALKRAEDLLELNRKKVEVGTLAPIEITEAEAGVASQVESVIVSETTLEDAEDALLRLLATPAEDPLWERPLDLTDRPTWDPGEIDLDAAITAALERRPELVAARQRLRDTELSERVARRGTQHGLDFNASVTPNEQDDVDQLVATLQPPGIAPSDTTTNSDATDWTVGLTYRFPLHNRDAKASYAIARLNTEKNEVALRNTEQAVRVDVRSAVRSVQSGLQRVAAAHKNVELQQQKLEAEQKKFDNGMSTSFEVLTFQNDLADAELAEIRARLDYVKALTALELAKGSLLEARGLSVE
jgi:outer membrane protein TolC